MKRHFPPPRWARDMYANLLREIGVLIMRAKEQVVSSLDDSIQRNTQAVADAVNAATQEIQQLKDALGGSATPEQLAQIDAATQALNDATAALQADDPAAPPA